MPLVRARGRGPLLLLAVAIAAFLALGGWLSERVGAWSEEVSTYPSGPHVVAVAPDGETAMQVRSCASETRLRTSQLRPTLALCAGGETWPVMVDSYISGWLYWPLASVVPRDVFTYRKIGLLLGVLSLLLGYWIVARLTDRWVAAAGALAAACASPFVLAHSLLVHYELTPLPLALLAVLVATRAPPERPMGIGRAAAFGLLCGMSLAANVKAVFLFAGLGVFAWPIDDLPLPRGRAAWVAAGAAALPLAPMLAFALMDSQGGFGFQILYRLDNLLDRLVSPSTLTEPLNLLTYWTDVAAYGDAAAGITEPQPWWPVLMPALALGFITLQLVQRLRERPHDPAAAGQGALVCTYVVAAALLYDQQPAANYGPLHAVFGFATAGAAIAVARALGRRFSLPARACQALAAALVLLSVAGFAYDTMRRGDPARIPLSTNAVAQRATVAHLEQEPGGQVVTATYNLAGVVDSISRGRVSTVHVEPWVTHCDTRNGMAGVERCMADRWLEVVERYGRLRVVLPARLGLSDESAAARMLPALRSLERRGEAKLEREARFSGIDTPPLLSIWDVSPAP